MARLTRWARRASSESRNSGPPRRPITTISDLLSRAPATTAFSSGDSRSAARSIWCHSRSVGAAAVACTMPSAFDTRAPQSARNVTGSSSTSRFSEPSGSAVSSSTASRSRNRLPPAAYRLIHTTCTPSSALQADTMESGIVPGDTSRSTSSTAISSSWRFSTISMASMSPPATPIALATRPSEPGTSGSSTRSRKGISTPDIRFPDPSGPTLPRGFVARSVRGGESLAQARRPEGPAGDRGPDVVRPTDHDDPLPGPGDRGVEELAGEQPGVRGRQQHHDLVRLAALALVDRHRMHGLGLPELAGGQVEATRAAGHVRAQHAVAAAYDDAGVAVVDAEPVVVGRQQQRAAGVPRRPDRLAGLLGQPALDLPVPVAYAVWPLPVGTEQALPVEGGQRGLDVTTLGGAHQVERPRHEQRAHPGPGVGLADEGDVLAARLEQGDGLVGVACAHGLGQPPDRLTETV